MTPAFNSVSAFLAMGGYGPYVWTCYGAFCGCLGLLTWQSVRRRRTVEANVRRLWRLAEAGESEQPPRGEPGPTARPFRQVDQTRP